ncbi:hypothetical protein CALVIDRAFT_602678 [Calocera viscosa TUFC12733]|uniref:Protein CPL1-like domain-containing protein n=1 Tax=Calocera viscosa (strain TUFC12733) TaxID=1330018 RepID=A0A167GPZ1_CALVF|nr:hypothetical protein CALVIDRAFT_602678 [Calocera viscosa TUFC12733]
MYTIRFFLGVALSLLALSLPAAAQQHSCRRDSDCSSSVGGGAYCSGNVFSPGVCFFTSCKHGYTLNEDDCITKSFTKYCACKSTTPPGSNYRRKRDLETCPPQYERCPVYHGRGGTECVDTMTDIESCGGCVGLDGSGPGVDCSDIEGAESVSCMDGACVIDECARGFKLDHQRSTCTPISGMRIQNNPLKRNFRME